MKTFDKVVKAKVSIYETFPQISLIGLTDLGDKWKINWDAGYTGCTVSKDCVEIIKEYSYNDDSDLDDIYSQEKRDKRPTPQIPYARLGVIAPNGNFYPCAYGCHDDLLNLLKKFCDSGVDFASEYRYSQSGWVLIKGSGCLMYDRSKLTEAQIHTLKEVIDAFVLAEKKNPKINWCEILTENPEGYHAVTWSTLPDENLLYESLAEDYRQGYMQDFEHDLWWEEKKGRFKLTSPDHHNILSKRKGSHPGD